MAEPKKYKKPTPTATMAISKMSKQVLLLCAVLTVCIWEVPARAAPIQFRMTGTIDVQFQVGPLPPGIFQEAPFEAILSYDLATPDSQPGDPSRGYYSTGGGPENFLMIRAGASEIRSMDGLVLWVGNDINDVQELFELGDDTFRIRDSGLTANFEVSRFALMVFQFNDPSRSVFSSDLLPTTLDPTSFNQPYIEVRTFQIDPRVDQFTIHALVDSIEVIPESTTITLVIATIASIAMVVLITRIRCFYRTRQQWFSVRGPLYSHGRNNDDFERMASVV